MRRLIRSSCLLQAMTASMRSSAIQNEYSGQESRRNTVRVAPISMKIMADSGYDKADARSIGPRGYSVDLDRARLKLAKARPAEV